MTLGIVKINSCVTSKLPIIKKISLVIIELVAGKFLMYIVNKQLQLQCVLPFINYLLLLVIIIQYIVK